jgi:nucleoside-diphosphate-sugar epimerase
MILVTGGTGLIGAHLLYFLTLENECVRATHRLGSDLAAVEKVFSYYLADPSPLFQKIEWVQADITDIHSLEIAFDGITEVYHSAALISFDPSDYKKMRQINIEGTANVVNFCISNKVSKLCYVSSVAAIGKTGQGINTEDNEWEAENNNYGYAITKYGAEMEVWRASQENIPVVIVNPGIVLGPGYWHQGSGSLFGNVQKGLKFYTEGVTGYVGVTDVVKAMLLLMQSRIVNERFILVAENWSYAKVFALIATHLGKKPPTIKVTRLLSELIWRLEKIRTFFTGKKPLLSRHTAKTIHRKSLFSSEKIQTMLDFEFQPIAEVIPEVCALYQKEISKKRK